PRRGGPARGREPAQGEDSARRARGQPPALGRARAARAHRRVSDRRSPRPRRPWADLVSGVGSPTARARRDAAPEVRRDGDALPPQGGMMLLTAAGPSAGGWTIVLAARSLDRLRSAHGPAAACA